MALLRYIYLVFLGYLGHSGYGQSLIAMYATGGLAAFQSGPNHYTVFTARSNPRDVHIVCLSTSLISEIYLIKDEAVLDMRTNSSQTGIRLNIPINETFPGRYTCVGKSSSMTKNGNFLNLTISTTIFVNSAFLGIPSCGTSLGSPVLKGEIIHIYCFGGRASWKGQPGINLETVLIESNDLPEYTCEGVNSKNQSVSCKLSTNISTEQISITISPTHFFSNGSDMEFVCHSSPYRLVYWAVYGMKGNLLDLNNVDFVLAVSTNITINQTESGSTLRISESAFSGNFIHAVSCYTFDTVTKVAVSAYQIDQSTSTTTTTLSTALSLTGNVAFIIQGAGAITLVALFPLLIFCLAVTVAIFILCNRKKTANYQPHKPDTLSDQTKLDMKIEAHTNPTFQP